MSSDRLPVISGDNFRYIWNRILELFPTRSSVIEMIGEYSRLKREIVEELPEEDIDENTIYMVRDPDAVSRNVYNEYMYIDDDWELIGSNRTDLSQYYTKSETDRKLLDKQSRNDESLTTDAKTIVGAINEIKDELDNSLLRAYPVGSIYLSVNNVNPSQLFGGTWVAWAPGRVPVGINTSDSDFDTVEETGGAKSHSYTPAGSNTAVTLTAAQCGVPAHSHGLNSHKHSFSATSGSGRTNAGGYVYFGGNQGAVPNTFDIIVGRYGDAANSYTAGNGSVQGMGLNHCHDISGTTGAASGSTENNSAKNATSSHNHTFSGTAATMSHMQPYITCYMWKRTA